MMIDLTHLEVWFITGRQHLYGEETLKKVSANSQEIVKGLNASAEIPVSIVFKPVMTSPSAITKLMQEVNSSENCIGIITWMHTFSPAKMWINGLKVLGKPIVHLHTQFNRDIPWDSIDMDFMNLNQSAHGGREYGYILSRMRRNRKVIVGHWQDPAIQQKLANWLRAAVAWNDWQGMRIVRLGDNMREVAVTEGDKVEAFAGLDPDAVPSVLVKGHGPFSWGSTPDMAVHNAVVLEQVCKMAFRNIVLGNDEPIKKFLLDKHYLRKHGKDAYYGQ